MLVKQVVYTDQDKERIAADKAKAIEAQSKKGTESKENKKAGAISVA